MSRSLALALCLAFALSTLAPVPTHGEVLGISPAELQSSWAAFRDDHAFQPAAGYRYKPTPHVPQYCTFAPVQLPDGAVVSALVVNARDDNAAADIAVSLVRAGNGGANGQEVVKTSTSGNAGSIRTFLGFPGAHVDKVVDSASEHWWINACFGAAADLELHHVYLTYNGRPAGVDTRSPVVVPAATFRTASGKGLDHQDYFGHARASSLADDGCFLASVSLPTGARISALKADVWDNSGTGNISVQLRRKTLAGPAASQVLAEVTSSGAQFSIRHLNSTTISHPVVSDSHAYYLTTVSGCLEVSDHHRLYSVRIEHDDPIYADGFESGNTNRWGRPQALLTIAPAAFGSAPGDYAGPVEVDPSSGILALDGACAVAAVTLPDGAEIFALVSYLRDADASRNLTLRLRRARGVSTVVQELAALTTNGSAANPQVDATFLSHVVDNVGYHYYVDACLPDGAAAGSFGIDGVQVSYFLP